MGEMIELTATDGFKLAAYRAAPSSKPRAGLVVLQEIFGVNHHIRSVADDFAGEGYLVIAPALFDRVERGIELGYEADERSRAMALAGKTNVDEAMLDVAAAVAAAREGGRVGVVGYCWGGTLAFLAAGRTPEAAAAVGYYGGQIAKRLDETPKAPLILHFGERDDHIPMRDVHAIQAALHGVPVYVYPAGHGFNCSERASYDEHSASLARTRTLAFLVQHLVGRDPT